MTYVVETKGRTLEETAALFDGDQQPQDLIQLGGEAATQTMTRANEAKLGLHRRRDDHEKAPTDFLELREDISVNISSGGGSSQVDLHSMTDRRLFINSSPY